MAAKVANTYQRQNVKTHSGYRMWKSNGSPFGIDKLLNINDSSLTLTVGEICRLYSFHGLWNTLNVPSRECSQAINSMAWFNCKSLIENIASCTTSWSSSPVPCGAST
ncbi:hypothetical protein J6590_077548 [Homalodisca vitripennis]|nr:hypothetical protein J6590_077548 [Homalodisca vitripennis]